MATHSSIPAWGIPGTGEPGGLPSVGPHRVGHDWSDLAAAAVAAGLMMGKWWWFPVLLKFQLQSFFFFNKGGAIFLKLINFFLFSAVSRTSIIMLNKSGEWGYSCLLPHLRVNAFTTEYDTSWKFVVYGLYHIEAYTLHNHFLETFFFFFLIIDGWWTLS